MSFDDTRYFRLLREACGLKPLGPSAAPDAWTLRALFSPTFHADCCLTLVRDGAWGAVEWIVLAEGARSAVMHELGFRGFAPAPGATPRSKIAQHEVAEIPQDSLARFMAVVEAVDPYALPDGAASGRDGMSVRCESQRGPRVHSFKAWSPSHREDPVHHLYLTALLTLAADSLREAQSHRTLAEVRAYLVE